MMNDIRRLCSEHRFALLLAFVVSIIVALPQVYFRIDHASDGIYQGIELLPDSPWSPRVREVQDGYPGLGSIYYKEGKDDPYLLQPFGSMVWGYFGKALSLDINNTFLAARFIFTFITVLLIYAFSYLVGRNTYAALCSPLVILLADSVLSYGGIMKLLQGIPNEEFLSIGKPVNNTMIYIPFFAFLVAFYGYLKRGGYVYGALAILFLGINAYNYFYTWTYLYAFGGMLILIALWNKQYEYLKKTIMIGAAGLIVAIPYVYNLYAATQHPGYEEVSIRFGVVLSRSPEFIGFVSLAALIGYVFLFPRKDKGTYMLGLSLLLAPIVTLNQQVLTGILMQEGHYHWYFHKPMAVIFGLIIFFALCDRTWLRKYTDLMALVIITVCLSLGLFIQMHAYYYGHVDGGAVLLERQVYGKVVEWLSEHAPKDSVLLANDEIAHASVIYTPLNMFYHRSAYASLSASHDRLLEVLFTRYRLDGVSAEDAPDVFYALREDISDELYGVYYRDLYGSAADIPPDILKGIVEGYQETFSLDAEAWLRSMLEKYEVSFVAWDTLADPRWNMDAYPFLREEIRYGAIIIYSVQL